MVRYDFFVGKCKKKCVEIYPLANWEKLANKSTNHIIDEQKMLNDYKSLVYANVSEKR